MKKNIFVWVTLFVAAMMFFSSCTKKTSSYIPKDAFMVATIEGAKVYKAYDKKFVREQLDPILLPMKTMYPSTVELLYKYVDDPSSIGINIDKEYSMYASATGGEFSVGFICSIKKQLLEKNIQNIADEFDFDIAALIKEKNGIKYIEFDSRVYVGWNKNVLIFIMQEDANFTALENLFNLKKEESISSNKDFKEFYRNKQIFNLWIASDIVKESEEALEFADKLKELTDIDIRNNYGHIHIDFNLSEVIVTSKLRMNETFRKADQKKIINNATKLQVLFEDAFGDILGDITGRSRYDYDYDYYDDYDYMDEFDYEDYDISEEEWEELLKMLDEE